LTRKETALLAATIETVSRVGPCEAEISLVEIKDVREKKRKEIIERAAELLKEWDQKSLDASEIEEKIDTDIKLGEIISWGPEDLPAGPDVEAEDQLIIVEGRADVLNLLRVGIKNTIAVQGTSVPKSVIELAKDKTVICYLDGDRGGDLILKELKQLIDIDYIARAPKGYEVEELTRKQLVKQLQKKRAFKEDMVEDIKVKKEEKKKEDYSRKEKVLLRFLKKLNVKETHTIIEKVRHLETGNAVGYDNHLNQQFEMHVSEIYENLKNYGETKFLIIDGILTERLLDLLLDMNIKFIACKHRAEDLEVPNDITVFYI
jgi:DNA primase